MSLPNDLHDAIQAEWQSLLDAVTAVGTGRPNEVSWIRTMHDRASADLEVRIRTAMRRAGSDRSVRVRSSFVHGNPFRVNPVGAMSRAAEIGDLMVIGQAESRGGLEERQALLLQMKVSGSPKNSSTTNQAELYATWSSVDWCFAPLRAFPGPHPRSVWHGPCRASQFAFVPADRSAGAATAYRVTAQATLGDPRPLASELAAVTRLDLGVDATPGPHDGWSRVVEDVLARSRVPSRIPAPTRRVPLSTALFEMREPPLSNLPAPVGRATDASPFLVIEVTTGPVGAVD